MIRHQLRTERIINKGKVIRMRTLVEFKLIYLLHTGSAKKFIHTLTKENCMFYVSTYFNYTS